MSGGQQPVQFIKGKKIKDSKPTNSSQQMLKLLTQKVCVFKHVAEDQGFIINTDSLSLNVYNTTLTREVHDMKHSQNLIH